MLQLVGETLERSIADKLKHVGQFSMGRKCRHTTKLYFGLLIVFNKLLKNSVVKFRVGRFVEMNGQP